MNISTDIICRDRPVLVAVSGGADSVALLHSLLAAGFSCVAAHCNFHLRGEESDSDEAFVRSLCERLGVPLRVAQFDTLAYVSEHKVSVEMAARELRYDWFFSLLDEMGIPVVAVAHHADDAAETFLLNLTRGTGLRGLTGMKALQGRVARPMLGVSRQEVELYCKANRLTFVTDRTNNSDDYARNKIRHHVIPQLKGINPSFLSTMRQNMAHLAQVMEVFQVQVDEFRARHVKVSPDGQTSIGAQGLNDLPCAEPFLFEVLSPLGFSPRSVHDVARCVAEGRWGRFFYSPSMRAVVDRSGVLVQPVSSLPAESDTVVAGGCPFRVSSPLVVSLSIFPKPDGYLFSRDSLVMHLDAGKVAFPVTFRHWRAGDAFRPLGMRCEKKLSDFFVDCKMSRPEKEQAWVAESDGRVMCVMGRRIDDRFKVTPSTKQILEIKYTVVEP